MHACLISPSFRLPSPPMLLQLLSTHCIFFRLLACLPQPIYTARVPLHFYVIPFTGLLKECSRPP